MTFLAYHVAFIQLYRITTTSLYFDHNLFWDIWKNRYATRM